MDITDSEFFFTGATGATYLESRSSKLTSEPEKATMMSFGDFALHFYHENKYYRAHEVKDLSELKYQVGSNYHLYDNQDNKLSNDIYEIQKNDPIMDVINELLNSKEYPEATRRAVMLILYQNGFYPRYSEVIRLPYDVLTKGSTHKGEPVRTFIEMDIDQCKMDLDEYKLKFLEEYPELSDINWQLVYLNDDINTIDTQLTKRIADPSRVQSAHEGVIKLRSLWKKVTTGPERNYPLSHFVDKYDIINPTTLTRTKTAAIKELNRVLGSYRNSVIGLNSIS